MLAKAMFRTSRSFCVSTLFVLVFLRPFGAIPLAAAAVARVELDCRIGSSSPGSAPTAWFVGVRRANGDPLWQSTKNTGEMIHVKNLEPGIYSVCVTGGKISDYCESFDLNPPAGRTFFKFRKELRIPEFVSGESDAQRINVSRMSVPDEARLELNRSEDADLHGKPDESIRHLERALQIAPNYPFALNNMGVHYFRLKQYASSIEYLKKAVALDPDCFPAWLNLGSSILATANFSEAAAASKRAWELRHSDARANAQLALSYYYLHEFSEAEKYFRRAEELDPMAPSAPQLFLAQIAVIKKDSSEAERNINDFLKLHPNSPETPKLKAVLREINSSHLVALPSLEANPQH